MFPLLSVLTGDVWAHGGPADNDSFTQVSLWEQEDKEKEREL